MFTGKEGCLARFFQQEQKLRVMGILFSEQVRMRGSSRYRVASGF